MVLSLLPIQGGPVLSRQDGDRGELRGGVGCQRKRRAHRTGFPFPKLRFAFFSTWFPAGSPGPSLWGCCWLMKPVKAQVGHQANNKHSCIAQPLSLLNGSSLHVSGFATPAPIAPPVSTTMPPHNYLTLMNLIFNFPAGPGPQPPNKGRGIVGVPVSRLPPTARETLATTRIFAPCGTVKSNKYFSFYSIIRPS